MDSEDCGWRSLAGMTASTLHTQGLVLDFRYTRRTSVVQPLHSPRVLRFGVFEADLNSGELRKSGLKLKLTGQPFQVLEILLERPGEVVTREELQKRLWPDTFVDIDHNLNAAVNKIREALGDLAENPRFVETLPRRGYRFIAPINEPAEKSIAVTASSHGGFRTTRGDFAEAVPQAFSTGSGCDAFRTQKHWRIAATGGRIALLCMVRLSESGV